MPLTLTHSRGASQVPVPPVRAAWNITSRGPQQAMALDLLLDDSVALVTLVGRAGTGKTLVALAAGLTSVVHRKK